MQTNLIDDASKEHPPIDAIEMSESEYEDNTKYNISQQQNHLNKSNKSNFNDEENKNLKAIQQQQLQVNQMQKYIDLCENVIALLVPNQRFPIEESDILILQNQSPYLLPNDLMQFLNQKGFESIQSFISDYISIENDVNSLKRANETIKREYHNLDNQCAHYQLDIIELKKEIEYLKDKEDEYIHFQDKYNQTCELNATANEEKVLLLKDISNLKDHINQRESTIDNMAILLKHNQSQYQNELNKIRSSVYLELKRDFDIHNKELYYNLNEKDNEINNLKSTILSMEKELLSSQSYSTEAELKLDSQQSQLKTQCEINENLSKDTYQSLTKLMIEKNQMNDYITSMQNDIEKLIKENESITMKYNNINGNCNELNDKYNRTNSRYEQLQLEYKAIEELNKQINMKNKMLYTEYSSIKENSSNEHVRIKKDNSDLNYRNEALLNENNQLRLQLKMMTESIQTKELEISNLREKINDNKSYYNTIRQCNINLELKEKELIECNKRLDQSIHKTNDELSLKHFNQESLLYDNEKLLNERSKIIEELSNEKTANRDKDIQLSHIIKLIRDNKSKLLELKEEEFFSFDYIAYLTESSIAKDYNHNICIIEDFITTTVEEINCFKAQINDKLQLINQSKEERIKIQNDNNSLLNIKYDLECKVKEIQDDNNVSLKKIKEKSCDYKLIQNENEEIRKANDKLSHENKRIRDYVLNIENKNDKINESISIYETIRCFNEEILIKMTKNCLYNSNIAIFVNDLIKVNYDLIQTHRDKLVRGISNTNNNNTAKDNDSISALNDQIDSKLKEIEFIYMNILKEIDIEKRLKANYSL